MVLVEQSVQVVQVVLVAWPVRREPEPRLAVMAALVVTGTTRALIPAR